MTKIEQIEHFQTRVHRFSLLMFIGDSHHHTLYIMYASRFKSPKKKEIKAILQLEAEIGAYEFWQQSWILCLFEFIWVKDNVPVRNLLS